MKRSQKRRYKSKKRRTRKRGGSQGLKKVLGATKDFALAVGKGYAQNVVTGSTPPPIKNEYKSPKSWIGLNDENAGKENVNTRQKIKKNIKI